MHNLVLIPKYDAIFKLDAVMAATSWGFTMDEDGRINLPVCNVPQCIVRNVPSKYLVHAQ